MATLAEQRCLNHAMREAVARCPECRRFFCRECVVEHEDRMMCSSCLRKVTDEKPARTRQILVAWRTVQFLGCILVLCVFFFLMGQALLNIPAVTHENTLWTVDGWEDE